MDDVAVNSRVALARRPVCANDIPLLRELYADSRTELAVLPPDARYVLIDMQFRSQRRAHSALYPDAIHDVLVLGNRDVGRLLVDCHEDNVHVVDISVALGRRGHGIATAALADVISHAEGRRVWSTIWSGNTAALALCTRAGLQVETSEGGYLTVAR